MKRIVIFLSALALLATGCNKGQEFTLTGDLASIGFDPMTTSLTLQSDALPELVTIPVENGTFTYTAKVEKPAAATLKTANVKAGTRMLVLEKGTITFQDGLPAGTALNDAASELTRSLREIMRKGKGDVSAARAECVDVLRTYLSQHGKDASAPIAIVVARRFADPAQLGELIEMTSKEVQNDSNVHKIKKQLKSMQKQSADQAD